MSNDLTGLDWPAGSMLPIFQTPQHLDIYDIRSSSHDIQLTITTLAGLINRPQPRVYLITGDDDLFWLKQMPGTISQTTSRHAGDSLLTAMLETYRQSLQGLIVYDPALSDTINVATTLAGQHDGIVVAPAQVQELEATFKLPVLFDLRTYRWQNRTQAYQWAMQNALSSASSHLIAGLAPDTITGLRSFLVATRTFVYWLDSRKYRPDLSNGLPSERSLMQKILSSFSPGMLHLGWFIDESSGVTLTSRVAMGVLASNYCINLEVLSAVRPQAPIIPHATPVVHLSPEPQKIYLSFTISDGDNLQYCQHRMLRLWHDPVRGSLPIGWTIPPALQEAAPMLAAYYMNSASSNDEFIAGPCGASYMFPAHWPEEQLTPFLQRTGPLMQAMGLTTLELLDTDFFQSSGLPLLSSIRVTGMSFTDDTCQHRFAEELAPFGLRGMLSGAGVVIDSRKKVGNIPLYRNLGLASSVANAIKLIKVNTLLHRKRPLFLNIYMLAWSITPTDIKQIIEQLGAGYEVVLPGTLLTLLDETL